MSACEGTALKFMYIFTIMIMFVKPRVNNTDFQPVSRNFRTGIGIFFNVIAFRWALFI